MKHTIHAISPICLLDDEEPLKATMGMMETSWFEDVVRCGLMALGTPTVTYKTVVVPGGTALLVEASGNVMSTPHLCHVARGGGDNGYFYLSCACGKAGPNRATKDEVAPDITAHLAEVGGVGDAEEGSETK